MTGDTGEVGRWGERVVFVPFCSGRTRFSTTGKGKTQYAHAKVHELLSASPTASDPVASWQISAAAASGSILPTVPVGSETKSSHPSSRTHWRIQLPTGSSVMAAPPLWVIAINHLSTRHISHRSRASWLLPKGSHPLINLNQCPVQDAIKPASTGEAGYPAAELAVYDERRHKGKCVTWRCGFVALGCC